MASKLPIAPMSLPSTLRGHQNGKLPRELLAKIGVGNAEMERTAARSFVAMFSEARANGFVIKEVGDYRPFETQLAMFIDRYEPVSIAIYAVTAPSNRKKWDAAKDYGYSSVYWRKKQRANGSYPATAATPGASNHGWGLALDIAEEYDNDPAPDPIRQAFVNWLCANAARYGISAELQSESWHWRYVAGDSIPVATLQFERAGGDLPPANLTPSVGPSIQFAYPGTPITLGSKGVAVKLVQSVVGATPDGDYGPVTQRRVKIWQASRGLVADGVVADQTWRAMFG
jgi:peptidoglycan hydrolase-like protein with peptidoglycan-binding domain